MPEDFQKAYPACRKILDEKAWDTLLAACPDAGQFPECLARRSGDLGLPGYLAELALLERALERTREAAAEISLPAENYAVNPTLQLHRTAWKGLAPLVRDEGGTVPSAGMEMLMLWFDPSAGEVRIEVAADLDLLALKIVVEKVEAEAAAREAGRHPGVIDVALGAAARKGVLLAPPPRLRRITADWPAARDFDEEFLVSRGFTLQWHITQACDLHCRHCYDRSQRRTIPLERAVGILDELREFCRRRFVSGHVTFTGGNPLLHPHFLELYREASERGFTMSILGNPSPPETIEKIVAIEKPTAFQVSLEGLEEHNDAIRGAGHYRRVMEFLPHLRTLGVSSMVMLTLTAENLDQVIPLGERLEGLADHFFFNRLAAVGEGAALSLPSRDRFEAFLEDFLALADRSPHVGLKDNLANILLRRGGREPFGGCTGFGCGAAFNFLTLLAEGEAHACRKLPSPLGNVLEKGLEGVYESEAARRYRQGCLACAGCDLRPVCGGCLAVTYGQGLDPFTERDPHCFVHEG